MTAPRSERATRLAEAVEALAAGTADPAVRTQLHALVGVIRNLDTAPAPDDPDDLARLAAAIDRGDEEAAVAAVRAVARARRVRVAPIDWSRASR